MKILLTGGAGFIGSHTAVELLSKNYDIVIADNFSNSKPSVLNRIKSISGKDFKFYLADICNEDEVNEIFSAEKIDAVIHFAGLKAVGESVKKPLDYYFNNLNSTMTLCRVMKKFGVKRIIFSSSATVYGSLCVSPIKEDSPLSCTSPYGFSKLMSEQILRDAANAEQGWFVGLLRYFNPVGAHESGLIGEDPNGIPNNLMPNITQVASGKIEFLKVFGSDYKTPDGTGVRDYIHVTDLAKGHISALEYSINKTGVLAVNLGTGKGYSVLEMINTFKSVNNIDLPYKLCERRPGDVPICFADPGLAKSLFDWHTEKTLEDMCQDSWRWQKNNPNGYED